jgi:hypothetical protein
VPLVRKICEDMGEQLEVNLYDRFTTLEVLPPAACACMCRISAYVPHMRAWSV